MQFLAKKEKSIGGIYMLTTDASDRTVLTEVGIRKKVVASALRKSGNVIIKGLFIFSGSEVKPMLLPDELHTDIEVVGNHSFYATSDHRLPGNKYHPDFLVTNPDGSRRCPVMITYRRKGRFFADEVDPLNIYLREYPHNKLLLVNMIKESYATSVGVVEHIQASGEARQHSLEQDKDLYINPEVKKILWPFLGSILYDMNW